MESIQTSKYNGHELATVFHDGGTKNVVIFCHGYRSTSIGPNRFFVRAARKLQELHISSLRFDQYGSGNSEGDYFDSSFNDWVATTQAIVRDYIERGYRVALFGQSMGGTTVIVAASKLKDLAGVVAWVPDAGVEEFIAPESGIVEESGQIVQPSYWQEAHDAKISDQLAHVSAPAYIVQCTDDEYVDQENRDAISNSAQPQHYVEIYEGYKHSMWSFAESEGIINKSVNFLSNEFK